MNTEDRLYCLSVMRRVLSRGAPRADVSKAIGILARLGERDLTVAQGRYLRNLREGRRPLRPLASYQEKAIQDRLMFLGLLTTEGALTSEGKCVADSRR